MTVNILFLIDIVDEKNNELLCFILLLSLYVDIFNLELKNWWNTSRKIME